MAKLFFPCADSMHEVTRILYSVKNVKLDRSQTTEEILCVYGLTIMNQNANSPSPNTFRFIHSQVHRSLASREFSISNSKARTSHGSNALLFVFSWPVANYYISFIAILRISVHLFTFFVSKMKSANPRCPRRIERVQ